MIRYQKAVVATALAALSFALMGAANPPASTVVTIYNPGNGDYTGYAIAVEPSGHVWTLDAAGRTQSQLPGAFNQAFFSDLSAAGPLSQLAVRPCTSSTSSIGPQQSLGIYLVWRGQHSPNLECSTDPRADRLLADAQAIARGLYVQAYRVRPVVINTGRSGSSDSYQYAAPARAASPNYSNAAPSGGSTANYGSTYGSYGASGYAASGNYGGGGYSNSGAFGGGNGGSSYSAGFSSSISSFGGSGTFGSGLPSIGGISSFGGGASNSAFASTMQFNTTVFNNTAAFSNGLQGGAFSRSSTFSNSGAFNGAPASGSIGSSSPYR